ncbi:MAG: hypothetical protein AMS18_08805 [Gemmatimonas sp. SG8_17]|nr:MAG: hypothetical protein AMS18_08805 [Gemmatimonas sp. SG8_17]
MSKASSSRLIIVLLMFLLQGCASVHVSELNGQLEKTSPCCSSVAEMPFVTIKYDDGESFKFQGKQPVYQFEEGKSPFAAMKFPLEPEKREISVTTQPLSYYGEKGEGVLYYYFVPTLLILDSDFKVTRKIDMYEDSFASKALQDSWVETRVALAPNENYLVLYANPKRFGQEITYRDNYTGTGGGYNWKGTRLQKAKFQPGGYVTVWNVNLEREAQ